MPKALRLYEGTVEFYGNNSGKAQPIRTKSYREASTLVGRSPGKFRRPPSKGRPIAAKNENFLSGQQRVIWGTSRRPISLKFEHKTLIGVPILPLFQNCEILPMRGHLPLKPQFFGVFLGTLPVTHPTAPPVALEQI